MTRTFLPLMSREVPWGAGRVGSGERFGGERAPDQGAERLQVDPVDGGLIGAGGIGRLRGRARPGALGLPAGDDTLEPAENRQIAVGPAGQRLERLVGLAGLFLLAGGVQDLDLGGQGGNLVGVLLDGLPGGALGESIVAGRQMGACQRLGPHRGRFRELFEGGADLAPGQELEPFQLRERGLRPGAGQFLEGRDLLGELGLVVLGGVGQSQRVCLLFLLDRDVGPVESARGGRLDQARPRARTGSRAPPTEPGRSAAASRRRWARSFAGRAAARPGCAPRRWRRERGRCG